MLDKMTQYNKALKMHGYVRNGDGKKPWSLRWTLGTSHIDVRDSDWTAYSGTDEITGSQGPGNLAMFLSGDYQNGGGL
jgi:hypothetical protein